MMKEVDEMLSLMMANSLLPQIDEDLRIEYNGKVTYLNKRLVESQGVSKASVYLLKNSHIRRMQIFEMMENTDDVGELKKLAAEFDELEFLQQELWGFPLDKNYHRWFDVPKCICPKMDNSGRLGTSQRITDTGCIIHGDIV